MPSPRTRAGHERLCIVGVDDMAVAVAVDGRGCPKRRSAAALPSPALPARDGPPPRSSRSTRPRMRITIRVAISRPPQAAAVRSTDRRGLRTVEVGEQARRAVASIPAVGSSRNSAGSPETSVTARRRRARRTARPRPVPSVASPSRSRTVVGGVRKARGRARGRPARAARAESPLLQHSADAAAVGCADPRRRASRPSSASQAEQQRDGGRLPALFGPRRPDFPTAELEIDAGERLDGAEALEASPRVATGRCGVRCGHIGLERRAAVPMLEVRRATSVRNGHGLPDIAWASRARCRLRGRRLPHTAVLWRDTLRSRRRSAGAPLRHGPGGRCEPAKSPSRPRGRSPTGVTSRPRSSAPDASS
jgi:hypothetical protein